MTKPKPPIFSLRDFRDHGEPGYGMRLTGLSSYASMGVIQDQIQAEVWPRQQTKASLESAVLAFCKLVAQAPQGSEITLKAYGLALDVKHQGARRKR